MIEAALAAALTEALCKAADEAAGATSLISINVELNEAIADGAAKARIERKTKTLVFATADYLTPDGLRRASATSIHKIVGA